MAKENVQSPESYPSELRALDRDTSRRKARVTEPPKAGVSEREQTAVAQDPKAKAEQRDPRGRFAPGHTKRGGRRPSPLRRPATPESAETARTQQAAEPQGRKAKAEQRDPRGRFVRGHSKRGGRRPGSLNKGGRKAAFIELVAAARDSEAEGNDPHQAVGAAIVNGLLQESTSKSLPYIKLLLEYGTDRPKIQDGAPVGPGRVWAQFGDKSGQHGQHVQAPHPERQSEESVVRDGEEFVVIKNTITRCPVCRGDGLRFWGGRARETETCELCGGTGWLTPSLEAVH